MLPYRPLGLQRRRYGFAVQLLVLTVLSASLVLSAAALLRHVPPALDANGNPTIARDYGSFDAVRQ